MKSQFNELMAYMISDGTVLLFLVPKALGSLATA